MTQQNVSIHTKYYLFQIGTEILCSYFNLLDITNETLLVLKWQHEILFFNGNFLLQNLLLWLYVFSASGLQLFIAKDGTAALGNHEVKSQMSAGVQVFEQVVMKNNNR